MALPRRLCLEYVIFILIISLIKRAQPAAIIVQFSDSPSTDTVVWMKGDPSRSHTGKVIPVNTENLSFVNYHDTNTAPVDDIDQIGVNTGTLSQNYFGSENSGAPSHNGIGQIGVDTGKHILNNYIIDDANFREGAASDDTDSERDYNDLSQLEVNKGHIQEVNFGSDSGRLRHKHNRPLYGPDIDRIGVNRGCIQDVNFRKKPWERDTVVDDSMGDKEQADRTVTYRDKRTGCLQMVKFADDDRAHQKSGYVLYSADQDTQIGIDKSEKIENEIHLSRKNYDKLLEYLFRGLH